MFLKNYTSDVPISQTIYRIEQVLIRCGAAGITKEYKNTAGVIESLAFQIETASGKIQIRLPVNVEQALQALWLDYADGDKLSGDGNSINWNNRKKKRRVDFVEQAERTAWKIMQDWVEVQMSMIQLKQADVLQVFLPYIITTSGQSVYQQVLTGGVNRFLLEGPK